MFLPEINAWVTLLDTISNASPLDINKVALLPISIEPNSSSIPRILAGLIVIKLRAFSLLMP